MLAEFPWSKNDQNRPTALPADTLNFLHLSHLCSSLDILEGDVLVLSDVDDASQVKVETFCCPVLLSRSMIFVGPRRSEYFFAMLMTVCKFCRILTLSISSRHSKPSSTVIFPKKSIKKVSGILSVCLRNEQSNVSECLKLSTETLATAEMLQTYHNTALDRSRILVVLERAAQEACLLAELSNPVVKSAHSSLPYFDSTPQGCVRQATYRCLS